MAEAITLSVGDGVVLEGEIEQPGGTPRAAMVLCHPHPQFGGTMRSIVISELFRVLPDRGVTCLRFNFRGVEASSGTYDEGLGERADAAVAVSTLAAAVPAGTPLVLAGWSFGGDVALSVADTRLSVWLAIAPPLRFSAPEHLEHDPRPKLVVLAENDEFRSPDEVTADLASWEATTIEVVTGASHFFVGRTDAVVSAADGLIGRVAR